MRRARISAAVLLAILVAACGTGERPSPRSGFEIYAANCASCHGDVATGDGAIDGTPIHGPAGHTWHHPDGQLVDIILGRNPSPGRTVPVFADTLTDQEVETVLTYLKTGWAPRQLEIQKGISSQYGANASGHAWPLTTTVGSARPLRAAGVVTSRGQGPAS